MFFFSQVKKYLGKQFHATKFISLDFSKIDIISSTSIWQVIPRATCNPNLAHINSFTKMLYHCPLEEGHKCYHVLMLTFP